MKRLLDVADVKISDGDWSAGYQYGAKGCGLAQAVTDDCNVTQPVFIANTSQAVTARAESGYNSFNVVPFSSLVSFSPHVRCSVGEEVAIVESATEKSSSSYVERVLKYGLTNWAGQIYLAAPEVRTVAAGSDAKASLVAALKAFYDMSVDEDPIVGLGLGAAADLSGVLASTGPFADLKYYVSPKWNIAEIAVTGPIEVQLSGVATIQGISTSVNRTNVEGTRLAAFAFDPCIAVRVV